jgi:hypothetical protein
MYNFTLSKQIISYYISILFYVILQEIMQKYISRIIGISSFLEIIPETKHGKDK